MTSSIIDMGAASRLPKYIKGLTLTSKGITDGINVECDYQIDDDIDTTTWTTVETFTKSPEQEININEGDIRQFRYRLRLQTKTATTPPDVKGVVPNGFARVPWRKVWHIRILAGQMFTRTGKKDIKIGEFLDWMDHVARYPGRVRMTSDRYPTLNDKFVIVSPPTEVPFAPDTPFTDPKYVIQINLMEL